MDSMEELLADRPECPYVLGFHTNITRHVAPDPFVVSKHFRVPEWYTSHERDTNMAGMSRMELVMYSPPDDNATPKKSADSRGGDHDSADLHLTVTKVLAGGHLRGAQLVLCTIEQSGKSLFTAVAKIFDPLYYPFDEIDEDGRETGECIIDTPWIADSDYSREAAAYEQLRDKALTEGTFTPRYYGSYTMSLSASHRKRPETTRKVRLILVEHIDGVSMRSLWTNASGEDLWQQLDEPYRMYIWARILECKALTNHAHIWNNDDFPRNRLITPPPRVPPKSQQDKGSSSPPQSDENNSNSNTRQPRVVLIDFADSDVWSRSDVPIAMAEMKKYNHSMPVNPIFQQWDAPFASVYRAWVPDWYFEDNVKRHQWLIDHFITGGEDGKYEKVEYMPELGERMHGPKREGKK